MAPKRRQRLSPLNLSPAARLQLTFERVKRFVSRSGPGFFSLSDVTLNIGCKEILKFRQGHPGRIGDRAFMHVEGWDRVICAAADAGKLPDSYQVGLILHEFGHIGSGGGEQAADEWVLVNFGIMLHYMGPLEVEWVNEKDLSRVLGRRA